ncbi:uncharacterized protein LOC128853236 isoform X2 [Cuculus canorus]|uniref:uncharacterized protein LOC128853236 isoform X2 n=1 Tax=Cuculus canorus TaxID=55661 RepID=UPI0023AB06F1|nr:uncharacterized protein LOC128853236 isoform X2 [Cuculus canorus]
MRIRPAAGPRHLSVIACGLLPSCCFGALPEINLYPKNKAGLSLCHLCVSWLLAAVAALDFSNFAPVNTPGCVFAAGAHRGPQMSPCYPELHPGRLSRSGLLFAEVSGGCCVAKTSQVLLYTGGCLSAMQFSSTLALEGMADATKGNGLIHLSEDQFYTLEVINLQRKGSNTTGTNLFGSLSAL